MNTVLRVRLTGDDAQLGRVAAGDVARMLLGVERAVARAAGHVIGRQVKPTAAGAGRSRKPRASGCCPSSEAALWGSSSFPRKPRTPTH